MNKLINKVKDNQYTLRYQPLDLPFKIVLFTDAAFGNLSDGGSEGRDVIFLVEKHNKSNLLSWQSKLIKRSMQHFSSRNNHNNGWSRISYLYICFVEGTSSSIK